MERVTKTPAASTMPNGWSERDGRLVAGYRFRDFAQAMGFLTEVGLRAEAAEHHPDFHVHWNEVRFEVWSHEANAITPADHALAAQIAQAAERHGGRLLPA
jgi:4a-hydroxytetrahydrobiopterin dehydratase